MEKVRYMISDAANIVHVESHVLRYWEDELELNIPRNEMGHRYYTKENIAEFQRIKELKEQGYQLKAIRMIVHNGPIEGLTAEAPIPVGQAPLFAGAAAAIPQPVQPVAAQPAAVAQPVQQSVQPAMYERLTLADSSCRTNSCTCSAANAGTCIDYELAVSLRNSSYWTFRLACSTAYTRIRNNVCHFKFPP